MIPAPLVATAAIPALSPLTGLATALAPFAAGAALFVLAGCAAIVARALRADGGRAGGRRRTTATSFQVVRPAA